MLKVIEVYHIAAAQEPQLAVDELTCVLPNDIGKGVVDWLLDENGITRLSERANGSCKRKDDTRRDNEVIGCYIPVVACGEPALYCRKIIIHWLRIAENTMRCAYL